MKMNALVSCNVHVTKNLKCVNKECYVFVLTSVMLAQSRYRSSKALGLFELTAPPTLTK